MVGIYLSGTGNTKHCIEQLLHLVEPSANVIPLEIPCVIQEIHKNDTVILGYPTQYSNAPFMVRQFIKENASLWQGKRVFCVATMGAFSGDGAGCSARLLKRYGAIILGGLHIRMPDSVCDSRLLKKTVEENRKIIARADEKIAWAAKEIRENRYPGEGITILNHIAGLLGQRLWFYRKTGGYSHELKISGACVGCGLCVADCPMKNLSIKDGKAVAENKCTMCYRCVSRCPRKAITLLGKEVREQCRFENYV